MYSFLHFSRRRNSVNVKGSCVLECVPENEAEVSLDCESGNVQLWSGGLAVFLAIDVGMC